MLILETRPIRTPEGKYRADFCLFEVDGARATITQYFMNELANSEGEACEISKRGAARVVRENYPEGTKLFYPKKQPDQII